MGVISLRKFIYALILFFALFPLTGSAFRTLFYGPTVANEHLWRIAMAVRPSNEVSLQQTMLAILRANPQAFTNGNVNGLKAGYHLKIPSFMFIRSVPVDEAFFIIKRQNIAWHRSLPINERPYHDRLATKRIISDHERHTHKIPAVETTKKINDSHETTVVKEHSSSKQTSSSLSELVKNKKATTEESPAANTTLAQTSNKNATTTPVESSSQIQTQTEIQNQSNQPTTAATTTSQPSTTSNVAQTSQAQMDKINAFMNDTNNFKQSTTTRLNNLENQFKTLNAQLAKLEQEFSSLTYHFIQIANTNTSNSWGIYFEQMKAGLKKYGLNLLIALLILLVLLLTSLRLRRRRRRARAVIDNVTSAKPAGATASESSAKKDEYDFMGSHEAIPSKIDLARAYIDMGDFKNAKETLNEVIELGNVQQQKEARDLLAKIPTVS